MTNLTIFLLAAAAVVLVGLLIMCFILYVFKRKDDNEFWCLLYVLFNDRKSYKTYRKILKSDKVIMCSQKDYSSARCEKKYDTHYDDFDHSFEYDVDTYYFVNVDDKTGGHTSIFQGEDCVISFYYKLIIDRLIRLKGLNNK